MSSDERVSSDERPATLTVYWRPGCGFCSSLMRSLESAGVVYERRNIWEDPNAAAFVRQAANGNETVTTVSLGHSTWVNPSPRWLIPEVKLQAPELVQEPQKKGFFRRG